MATKQVTVTIPEDEVAAAKRLASQLGLTLSAYTAKALRAQMVHDALVQMYANGYTDVDAEWIEQGQEAAGW